MMGFSFLKEVRMKVRVNLGDSLSKNILRKKIAWLLNEEISSHLKVF